MADGTDPLAGQQLPIGVDPTRIASLFPQTQPTAAPTVRPAGIGPLDDPNLRSVIQQQAQTGLGAFSEREQAAMDINRRLSGTPGAGGAPGTPGLIQTQEEASKGLGFQPKFGGGFLHNLGQALIAIGASTTPGQAIENVVYSGPRREYAGRAEEIKNLQAQEEQLEKGLTPASQLAYKPFQAEAAERKAGAAITAAQARADAVIANRQTALDRIAAMKDINQRNIAAREEITKLHDEMMVQITGMKDVTQEDVARIMTGSAQTLLNTKIAEDPSIFGWIKQKFGIAGPQAPGGEQPVQGAAPLPPRPVQPGPAAKPGAAGPPQNAKRGQMWKSPGGPRYWDGTAWRINKPK